MDESSNSNPASEPVCKLEGFDHVALLVRDVKRSVAWYQDVLGLERYHEDVWDDHPAVVGLGGVGLAIFRVKGDDPKPRPGPDTIVMRHLAFRADGANFARAKEGLRCRGIEFDTNDHGIAHSVYFFDPDGHQLELTTYDVEGPLSDSTAGE